MSLTQGIRKVYFYSWLPYSADRRQHIDDGIFANSSFNQSF
ncbi:hypothetical protein [Coleofasciculus sp. FACHB-542]|nr:hypothetical protein [Coleofasciculus sp. FACHB-542]